MEMRLSRKKLTFVSVLTAINFILVGIGGAILGYALAYGATDGNVFVGIICAIIGLIIAPMLWQLALRLAFPELILAIYAVNNGAYDEITELKKRIDVLEKALGERALPEVKEQKITETKDSAEN